MISKKLRSFLLGLVVFVFSLVFSSRAIEWCMYYHTDEIPITNWITQTIEKGYITSRVYPSGWFELIRPVVWLRNRCSGYEKQDGGVNALVESSFVLDEYSPRNGANNTYLGRKFNVLLLSLAATLTYLAGLSMGCNIWASFCGALLLVLNPFTLEHVHYCETDISLIFSLSLVFYLATIAVKCKKLWIFLVVAFAGGFAFSCKYTLSPLFLFPIILVPFCVNSWKRAILWVLASIPCLLLGVVAGTPVIYKDFAFFLASSKRVSALTYAEIQTTLGAYRAEWWAPFALRFRGLVEGGKVLGIINLLWLFFSAMAGYFARRFRTFTLPVIFFGGAYILFAVFGMPFIRNQEFLPIIFVLSFLMAPAITFLWERKRVVAVILTSCVMISALRDGLFMNSYFAKRDTRSECQNALIGFVRDGTSIAFDDYVGVSARGVSCIESATQNLEEYYPKMLEHPDVKPNNPKYYLSNVTHQGRGGGRTPFGRKLPQESLQNIKRFRKDSTLLAKWAPYKSRMRPTFAQFDIEFWHLGNGVSDGDLADIPLSFDRPYLFHFGDLTLYDFWHLPIGPIFGIQTTGKRHNVSAKEGAIAVTQAFGDSAISIDYGSAFLPRKMPCDGATASRCGWQFSALYDAFPVTRIRMRGDDQRVLAITTLHHRAGDAAYLVRRSGNDLQAHLLVVDDVSPLARVQDFLASIKCGVATDEETRLIVRDTLAAYDAWVMGGKTNAVKFAGVPYDALRDFSVLRIPNVIFSDDRELPVLLPKGEYSVTIKGNSCLLKQLKDGSVFNIKSEKVELKTLDAYLSELTMTVSCERDTRLKLAKKLPNIPNFRDRLVQSVTIRWDVDAMLDRSATELREVLSK